MSKGEADKRGGGTRGRKSRTHLVLLADSSEDRDSLGDRRLVDLDLSESSLESSVLLDELSELQSTMKTNREETRVSFEREKTLVEEARRGEEREEKTHLVERRSSDTSKLSSRQHRLQEVSSVHSSSSLSSHDEVDLVDEEDD